MSRTNGQATDATATARALLDTLISPNVRDRNDEPANVVDALDGIGSALRFGLKYLGNGDAGTTMGAIEAHGVAILEAASRIEDGLSRISTSIDGLADAIREHGSN